MELSSKSEKFTMLTRLIFLTSLVLVVTVFLTGAWPGPLGEPPPSGEPAFVPQSVPLDDAIQTSGLDGKQLLRKAADALSWRSTPWLKTKIRHTSTGAKVISVVEGFLQRGPNHCVRLEWNLADAERFGTLTLVSDGKVIAEARQISNEAADVVVERLVEESPDEPAPAGDVKEETLDRKGAGGPGALLRRLQQTMRDAKTRTGMLGDKAVIRIAGEMNPGAAPVAPAPIDGCQVYLDARTLWPWRVEWLTARGPKAPREVMRVEFLEPEIAQALSDAACIRMFSYRPKEPRAE